MGAAILHKVVGRAATLMQDNELNPMYATLKQPRTLYLIGAVLFFCVVALVLFSANMQRGLSHDEHMYVAGGDLASKGLGLPYRDYPYLQMPNLALIYAGLFAVTDYLLLSARVFSTLAALGSLAQVFMLVSSALRGAPYLPRFILAAGSVALIINNSIFAYTSGQAWNHDLPVLLCLGAFALVSRTLVGASGAGAWWFVLGGLLVGLAVGTRLLFLLIAPVFLMAVALSPHRQLERPRPRRVAAFLAGMALGLLPSLALFVIAPGQFLYGNLVYHQANAAFWETIGYTRAMDLAGKIAYTWEVLLQPENLAPVLGFLALGVAAILVRRLDAQFSVPREVWLAIGVTLVLLVGAFVPDPTWYQYYFAPLPFLTLSFAYCAAALYRKARSWLVLFVAVVAMSFVLRPPLYPVENLLYPDSWATIRVHKVGVEVRRYAGDNRVLTFAPIYPLEGGAQIYRDFAAGPFTWRSLTFISDGQRAASGLMSPAEIERLLQREPPRAILVGFERDLEVPWIEFARGRNYREVILGDGATLWLAPGG